MVASGEFSHGASFGARITAAGFAWSASGENIATGFQTPREVVDAWMSHPGHCQNILDPTYADVGTGVSPRAVGAAAGTPSTWVQDFALPRRAPAPSTNWGPAHSCPD